MNLYDKVIFFYYKYKKRFSFLLESISNLTYPIEQNPLPSPSIEPSIILNTESETLILDPPIINLPNEYYPLMNDFLQEISIEMNDKTSVDIFLEIEESLAQRIYDCIVEQDDDYENDTKSYSTTTNDSSALSVPPPQPPVNNIISNESNDLPPSPICTTTREVINNQEKCNMKIILLIFNKKFI
jgi:hypothetical protein